MYTLLMWTNAHWLTLSVFQFDPNAFIFVSIGWWRHFSTPCITYNLCIIQVTCTFNWISFCCFTGVYNMYMQLLTKFLLLFIMLTEHFDNLEIYLWILYSGNLLSAKSNMCPVLCMLIELKGLFRMQSYFVFYCHSRA